MARQHSAYSLRDVHLLPPPPLLAARTGGCMVRAALAAARETPAPADERSPWRLAHVLLERNAVGVGPVTTEQACRQRCFPLHTLIKSDLCLRNTLISRHIMC